MIKIYHNSRCGKSRAGLAILEKSNVPFEIIKYLETPLNIQELKSIIDILGIKPIDLIRINEKIWIENFKGKLLTDDEIVAAITQFPILMERPIVIHNNKGVIGRPPENIETLL